MLFRSEEKIDKLNDFHIKKNYVKKSLNEIIYENLKGKILRGDISSDDRLQEDNLTKEYETSRTPIRDALRRLEHENIIEKLHYGGYKVKDLTMKNIEDIFGIRRVLESYAASLATLRMTEDDVKKMEAILRKSQEALVNKDYGAFIELNTEFHLSLYSASKSEYLLRILQNLRDYFYRYRKIILKTKSNLEDSLKNHEMMIQKMKEGDQDAVEHLVKEHVNRALKVLKKEMNKSGLGL